MIPRSQGHCYLRHLHCHHHCPVWPETGGNPRCCPGPQGLDLSRSRNRRLASQGWHKSRGWRHRCHPQRWERATCGMVAGWPAYHPGTPLSILVTRRSRPLEASGPPCWLGRVCGGCRGNKGGLVRRTACSLVPRSLHPRLPAQGRPPVAKCPDPASIPRDNGAGECVFRNCITLFAKEPSPGPVAQPRALLVSNIFQNDSGKE